MMQTLCSFGMLVQLQQSKPKPAQREHQRPVSAQSSFHNERINMSEGAAYRSNLQHGLTAAQAYQSNSSTQHNTGFNGEATFDPRTTLPSSHGSFYTPSASINGGYMGGWPSSDAALMPPPSRSSDMSDFPPHVSAQSSLASVLPPRRELPSGFPRPSSMPTAPTARSRPSSSTSDLPALPKPKVLEAWAGRPTTRSRQEGSATARSEGNGSVMSSSTLRSEALPQTAYAGHPDRPLSSSRPLAPRSINSTSRISSGEDADADYEIVDKHGAFLSKPETRPKSTDQAVLAEYAAQSSEDRLNILNALMCGSVVDENFVKLCEDVDKCWRRIGLGI